MAARSGTLVFRLRRHAVKPVCGLVTLGIGPLALRLLICLSLYAFGVMPSAIPTLDPIRVQNAMINFAHSAKITVAIRAYPSHHAPMKFTDYLTASGITVGEFADISEIDHKSIYKYRAGQRTPSPAMMRRISIATEGAVQPNDWINLNEEPTL
jgi:hypothetical protein